MSNENEPLTDHEYDGIRELDNRLPEWWLYLFFGTIIFSFIYWIHYEIAGGLSSDEELALAMAELKGRQVQGPLLNDSQLAALMTPETLTLGEKVYTDRCAVCHGPQGGGVIGPNLTDKHWISGQGSKGDVFRLVAEGIPAKGMPAWRDVVSPDELTAVSLYVHQMQGKFVDGGKAPQGNEVP